jgi:TonB-dependent starch-binding outer membrane protein SusC
MNRKFHTLGKALALAGAFYLYPPPLFPQTFASTQQLGGYAENQPTVHLRDALLELQTQFGVEILFEEKILEGIHIDADLVSESASIEQNLSNMLRSSGLKYRKVKKNAFLITEDRKQSLLNSSAADPTDNATSSRRRLLETIRMDIINRKPLDIQVRGRVTDEEGQGLPGVNVLVKGTSTGTTTDVEGNYSISAPNENSVLVFSYIGYATQEVALDGRNTVNVSLQSDVQSLNEVVVVGYGTQKRSDVTGAVATVSAEEILRAPVNNAIQGLQGRVAGVNVFLNSGSPTSSPRVVIRGIGTINANSSPLYVVDGVVMEGIQFLNPNDIESMEVLKDASSTAIYGARGANGVILVTTRRGARSEGLVIGYDGFLSVGRLRKKMDLLDANEWMQVVETGIGNVPKYRPSETGATFTANDPRLFDANGNPLYNTDWQEEATRTAVSHNHQLSIQSRGEKSSFGTFMNYSRMEGIMLNSWMERLNGKIAYDATPKNWLSVGMNMLVNYTTENEVEEGGGHQMPRRTMIEMPPIFPVRFPDGTWSNTNMITDEYRIEPMANPVHVLETQERLRRRTQLFGNVYTTFHILPGLDLRTQFGFDVQSRNFQDYFPTDLINISAPLGRARLEDQRMNYWQQETFLSYNKEFGDHRINSVLGLSWQERTFEANWVQAEGFADNFFRYNRIQAASQPGAPQSSHERWALNSYFLRGGYTFRDKYMATVTARIDGSSRFGANNKYGFFPSLGLGWMLSNEPFLQNIAPLNELKIRSSFGVTGNSEIPVYQSLATVNAGTVLIGGNRAPEYFVNRLANQNLRWERTQQFDIGFNTALFNHRLSLEFDYYHRLTTDLLLDRPVPHTTGFATVRDNIGSVSNRGIEMLLTTTNVQGPNFTWQTTLNANFNRNRIEKLGQNNEDIEPGPFWVSGSQTILRVGESLGSFWGYERQGVWGTDEAEAAAERGYLPGEAKRAPERSILGKGLPDWTGSLINTLRYRNFDFTFDLQFVYGVDILQQFYHSVEDRSGIANGLRTILTEAWTPQNQNTMVQEIRHAGYGGQNSEVYSRWLADGSYLRGNLFTLGYSFNQNLLSRLNLQALRVYGSVQNAFVIHSREFQGYDPEATSWGGDQWGQNIFFFQYPKPTTYTVGVSLQF